MEKTRVSSKGQIVIPKSIRDEEGWTEGTELDVERTPAGVILRNSARTSKARKSLDEVAGSLKGLYRGPVRSLDDMQKGIDAAMQERWERKKR